MSKDYVFNPQWKGDKPPEGYKGTLPFDRFGPNGHRFYSKDHSNRYGHFCPEWDYMWICEDCKEFEACSCFKECDPNDEVWFKEISHRLIEIEELCGQHGFEFDWTVVMPHMRLIGRVQKDSTANHYNESLE